MYPYQQYGGAPAGMGNPDMMGGMGGGMRPSNRMASPYSAPTGGVTPPPFEDSGPVTFSTRPMRIKNPEPTQNNDIAYTGGTPDFDETTGTYRNGRGPMLDGRGTAPQGDGGPSAGLASDDFGQPSGDFWNRPPTGGTAPLPEGVHGYPVNPRQMRLQQLARPTDDGYNQQRQQMNPFMGGQGFNPMGGGFGGFGQQMQQMNPFMGGQGFGGGFGGFGQQMQNPFMGGQGFNPMGGGFGGFGGFGGYGQQMQNPFMGSGGFGQQMQQPMQQMQPLQRMAGPAPQQAQPQQQQSPMAPPAPMGYQGGAF